MSPPWGRGRAELTALIAVGYKILTLETPFFGPAGALYTPAGAARPQIPLTPDARRATRRGGFDSGGEKDDTGEHGEKCDRGERGTDAADPSAQPTARRHVSLMARLIDRYSVLKPVSS